MKGDIWDAFETVRAPEDLRRKTAEKMLADGRCRRPFWKAAAVFGMLVLILAGAVVFPGNEKKPDGLVFSVYAADGKNQKEIHLSKDAVQITVDNGSKYRAGGMGGCGDGKTITWEEQIDFNIHCSGRGDIKRVTYTAYNCEFLKKSFFTQEQVKNGEADQYADRSLWGETDKFGNKTTWGFSPIGYVYSADYMEQINLNNFGLKLQYVEENTDQYQMYSQKEHEKFSQLRKAAYDKAYLTAQIELENGSIINKTIKIGLGNRDVTAWISD